MGMYVHKGGLQPSNEDLVNLMELHEHLSEAYRLAISGGRFVPPFAPALGGILRSATIALEEVQAAVNDRWGREIAAGDIVVDPPHPA